MRLLVRQCPDSNVGNVVSTDKWDQTVLAGSEDLIHLGDRIYQSRLRQIFWKIISTALANSDDRKICKEKSIRENGIIHLFQTKFHCSPMNQDGRKTQ